MRTRIVEVIMLPTMGAARPDDALRDRPAYVMILVTAFDRAYRKNLSC